MAFHVRHVGLRPSERARPRSGLARAICEPLTFADIGSGVNRDRGARHLPLNQAEQFNNLKIIENPDNAAQGSTIVNNSLVLYILRCQRLGPIAEGDLIAMHRSGTIDDDTLVWTPDAGETTWDGGTIPKPASMPP